MRLRDWHARPPRFRPLDLADVLGPKPRRVLRPGWLTPCTCRSDDCPALPDVVALVQDTPHVFDKHGATNALCERLDRRAESGWPEREDHVQGAVDVLDLLATGGAVDLQGLPEASVQLAVGALQAVGWRLVGRPDPFKAPAGNVVGAVEANR